MTVTTLYNAQKRWLPTLGATVALEYLNEVYQEWATRYPLYPGTVTFNTVVGQLEYDLTPSGTVNTGSREIKRIRFFTYDTAAQKAALKQITFDEFVMRNPSWKLMGNGTPEYLVWKSHEKIMLWPAPATVVACEMICNMAVTDLDGGTYNTPVGIPSELQRGLALESVEKICEEFDNVEVLPVISAKAKKFHQKVSSYYLGDRMMAQMQHQWPMIANFYRQGR